MKFSTKLNNAIVWKEKLQKKRKSLAYLYRMVFDFVRFASVELYLPICNIGCVKKIDEHESEQCIEK